MSNEKELSLHNIIKAQYKKLYEILDTFLLNLINNDHKAIASKLQKIILNFTNVPFKEELFKQMLYELTRLRDDIGKTYYDFKSWRERRE